MVGWREKGKEEEKERKEGDKLRECGWEEGGRIRKRKEMRGGS